MKFKTLTLISISLLFSFAVLAQGGEGQHHKKGEKPEHKQRPSFSTLDTNSDGAIEIDEFSSYPIPHGEHTTVFANIDTDGDSEISQVEFESHKPPHRKKPDCVEQNN
ncbi:EF-hand domain-containing protein [Paraglaciecola sp.]|uniref:EF-hand domain-containing protein n=1 Tax=Paraglaciecola sp. TaxID=1920173 RepID=UPI003EF6A84F